MGAGADGFCRTAYGFASADAAFRDADFGGGHGRAGLVRRTRHTGVRLAGHAVAADLRQCVFQPAGFGALGVSGICACAAGAVALGAIVGRGRVAAVCLGRMAGGASMGRRRRVPGVFILFFRLRTGLAARRRAFCNGGSGNLPAGGVRVGHGACVGVGVVGAGGYGGGRRFVCVLEQARGGG